MFINIAAYVARRHAAPGAGKGRPVITIAAKAGSVAGTIAAAVGVVLLEPEPLNMLLFLATTVTFVAIVAGAIYLLLDRSGQKKNTYSNA